MLAIALVVLGALIPACSTEDAAPSVAASTSTGNAGPTSPAASPNTGPTPPEPRLADTRIRLVPVAQLEQPVAMAVRVGDRALYVAEKVGRVVALSPGPDPRVVLDLTNRVSLGSEQGLLGLAFSPNGRYLYVDFTDTEGDTNVAEFAFDDDGADPASGRLGVFAAPPVSHPPRGGAFGVVRRPAVLEPQRGRARVRTGRVPVRGARRRRERRRSDGERAVALGAARQASRDLAEPLGGRAVRDPSGQPVRRLVGCAPGDLGLRPAEPVAVLVRRGDRRPVDRRRRGESAGGNRQPAR